MFYIHKCYYICICVTWKCHITWLVVCATKWVLGKVHLVYWLPFLAWEKVTFCLSFARCDYPWTSKERCGILNGEWRFNITKERKWAECRTAGACAAEETPQSSHSGWAGQLWLRGESVTACFTHLDSMFRTWALSDLVYSPCCLSCCLISSHLPVNKVEIHLFSRKWNSGFTVDSQKHWFFRKTSTVLIVYGISFEIFVWS